MVKSSQQKEKLHQLYALYEQPLYRIAYAILHQTEQAEDAVSDAFLKIIPHLDQIESPDSPKTCLLYTSPSPRDLSTSRMPSSA